MNIERLDHLHIYVRDLERTIGQLEDLMGVKFTEIMNWEEWGIRDAYAPPGLNVIQPTSTDSAVNKFIERKGQGLAGVSFKVSNIEGAIAELQAKGLRLLDKVQLGSLTEALFEPLDPLGVTIELCEYPGDDIHEASFSK
ncbi:VOC family protein [Chloroflexota bacterium]